MWKNSRGTTVMAPIKFSITSYPNDHYIIKMNERFVLNSKTLMLIRFHFTFKVKYCSDRRLHLIGLWYRTLILNTSWFVLSQIEWEYVFNQHKDSLWKVPSRFASQILNIFVSVCVALAQRCVLRPREQGFPYFASCYSKGNAKI